MRAEGWLYWMTVGLSAAAAVSNKDDKLRDLLADNGITINESGEPVPSASGPAEKTAPAETGKTP